MTQSLRKSRSSRRSWRPASRVPRFHEPERDGSTFTRYKTPAFVNLDFKVTFTPKLLRKDLDLGLDSGRKFDVPLPLAALTRDFVQTMIGRGMTEEDFAQLLVLQAERRD